MELATFLAQFAAVFVAAFLAFGLEDLRERRRTARWVREHLRHLRELMRSDDAATGAAAAAIDRYLAALDTWLAAEQPAEVSESDWEALAETFNIIVADFGPVLRSEAVTVLPQDLALALARIEAGARTLSRFAENFQAAYQDMLPAWHERRVPLPPADASRVRRVRRMVAEIGTLERGLSPLVREVLAALDDWRPGRRRGLRPRNHGEG